MPLFELQGPDGATYEIEAPDEQAALGAFQRMNAPQAAPQQQPGRVESFFRDMARSVSGQEPPTVTPQDIEAHRKRADDAVRSIASGATFGMADELAAGGSTLAGGGTYSENLAAERARDKSIPLAIKLPGEIAGGVITGMGASRAGLSLLNSARPTVGSMALRGAGEGAAYGAAHGFGRGEGFRDRLGEAAYGATVGALTGAATGGIAGRMAERSGRAQIPTTDALRTQANRAYKAAEDAGVVVSKGSFSDAVDDIARAAKEAGIDKTIHSKAFAALNRLQDAKGSELSLRDIDTLRRVLRGAAASNEADERRIASIMIDKLDDYVSGLSLRDIMSGDVLKATSSLNKARDLWGRMRKGEIVEDMIERARNSAPNFSASGFENALRTQFRQLANNAKRMRGFSKAEQEAIQRVARGGPIENALRFIGKLAPRGIVSGGFHVGVAALDPTLGAATMLAGEAGRRGATMMTGRNAQLASELMRSGGTIPAPQQLTPQQLAILEALLITGAQQGPPALGLPAPRVSTVPR